MAITWNDLDVNLQNIINKKLDQLDNSNKNIVYANDGNGNAVGINYGSAINIENRIVQVDETGNILVPDINDDSNNKVASNKGYVSSKVTVLNQTIKDSMPQITVENDILTITTNTTK